MNDTTEQPDSAFFQSLIEQLTANHPWVYTRESSSPREAAERASTGGTSVGELRLMHLHTDAELSLVLPDHCDGHAARAVLDHPLDDCFPPSSDGFVGSLSHSHQTIATVYQSEYVEPVRDPSVILKAYVPFRYTNGKLYALMTAITATALRTQRLHEAIQSPVNEFLSEYSTPPNGSGNAGSAAPGSPQDLGRP